jgi:ribonuclease HI
MRVFTDGACSKNGKPDAKAGYAVWFPENKDWSEKSRVPDNEPQTNNRGELKAIQRAVEILEAKGCLDEQIVIYSDSTYCIDCLTKWIIGWKARGWKTSDGKDVLNRDIIEDVSNRLSRFASYRFHYVRAHTGGGDDLSLQNDIVDRMARSTIDDTVREIAHPAQDELFAGCPLRLMGPPIPATEITRWMREHLNELDAEVINHHLYLAFKDLCAKKDVNLVKKTTQKIPHVRAERGHLQISHLVIEKIE